MKCNRVGAPAVAILAGLAMAAWGQFDMDAPPSAPPGATRPATAPVMGRFDLPVPVPDGVPAKLAFPHVGIDAARHQVWLEAETLATPGPLEFFCCQLGTNEYEALLHSPAKASDLHTALLIAGQTPGTPVHYDESDRQWHAPVGPLLDVAITWVNAAGKTVRVPAFAAMRNIQTKHPMPLQQWTFVGSRVMDDGTYAADATGYLISIVNFDLTTVDVPQLASSANETLEWEINPTVLPKAGTRTWIILTPASNASSTQAAAVAGQRPARPATRP